MDLIGRSPGNRSASFEVLQDALATANWLAKVAQLDFVLGPLPDRSGAVLRPVTGQFGLHVYPWLEVEELPDADGLETATIVARLHQTSGRPPAGLARVEDFVVPHRRGLEDALAELESPWHTGP